MIINSFYFHLEPIYQLSFCLQVSSLAVRKIDNLNDRLNFKLETATLALLSDTSRRPDAISLQKACFSLQGFPPCRIYDRKAQLICTRPENVFTAALLIRDYYQFLVHEGKLQPSIPTERPFDGISSVLPLGNPLSASL